MRGSLVLIQPWDPATSTRRSIRVGAGMNAQTRRADGFHWQPILARAPLISMDYMDVNFAGRIQTGRAQLQIHLGRGLRDGATELDRKTIDSLIWKGAPISVWAGDDRTTGALASMFNGLVTSGEINRNSRQVSITAEVNRRLVDVPLLNLEYGGGGGADGDAEFRGQLKPACFGRPVNVEVFFFDIVNNIGQIDAYGNVTTLDNLYEDAASFGAKQGNYASYAALAAATLAEGQWATCVAEGLVRLGAEPRGVITCDPVCGAGTPGAMMLRWLQTHAGVSAGNIDSASFTSLDSALATLLGHACAVSFHTRSQVEVGRMMEEMCASVNAAPLIRPDGKIAVARQISASAAALTINRVGGENPATDWRDFPKPDVWWRLKAPAAISYRVHSRDEIDYNDDLVDRGDFDATETYREGHIVRLPSNGIRYLYINATPSSNSPPNATYWEVYEEAPDAGSLKYLDGTPIEALKPAEIGSDVTGDNVAAAIVGQGALATLNNVVVGQHLYDAQGNLLLDAALLNTEQTFAPRITYTFDAGTTPWVSNGITLSASGGLLAGTATTTDPQLINQSISVEGAKHYILRLRVRNVTFATHQAWDGVAYYLTGGHGYSNSFRKTIPMHPKWLTGEWHVLEFDMADLTAGGTDFITNTIDRIRFDLGTQVGNQVEVDWITYGDRSLDLLLARGVHDFADVTADNSAVGDGNRVRYSLFESGPTVGWTALSGSSFITSQSVVRTSGIYHYLNTAITFTAGSQTVLLGAGVNAAVDKALGAKCTAGERLFVGARLATSVPGGHTGTWSLKVRFTDAAGAAIGSDVTVTTGTAVPALSTRQGGFVTAPANATHCHILAQLSSSGAGAYTIHMAEPMIMSAGVLQTVWPAFAAGPSNEFGADVTSVVDGVTSAVFRFDYTGATAESGEFPRDLQYKLVTALGYLSSGVTWTYLVKTGTVNGFTNASGVKSMTGTGVGTFTVSSLGTDSATVEIRGTINGISRTLVVTLTKDKADAPTGSGSGATTIASKSSGFANISSTTFVDITGTMTGTMPTGKTTASLALSLTANPGGGAPNGSWTVEAKFQRFIGGVWTDRLTVATGSSARQVLVDPPETLVDSANLSKTGDETGLTAGTSYDWRVLARVSAGGTRTHSITGSVTVVVN